MRKVIIIICFIFSSILLFGQVPGYMGKKIHLQGGIKFFPSFSFPVNLSQVAPYEYVVPGMNYRLETGMDFMVSRKSSVGFNFHYYNTATYYYGGSSTTYGPRVAIDSGALGIVFKTHFGPWIAPLGFYYRLETGALVFTVNDFAKNFGGTFASTTSGSGYINNAFGRTHIFWNKISLDYGVELGFVFPPYNYNTIQGATNVRMAVHYAGTFYVKIGGVF